METAIHSFRQFFRFPLVKGGGEIATNPRVYTASGAIAITPGLHLIQGGLKVMTLAQPTAAQEGIVLTIYNSTAAAHTVTAAGGYGGGGAVLATFNATTKVSMTLMAVNLHWTVLGQNAIVFS